jgi:hypothetical protein
VRADEVEILASAQANAVDLDVMAAQLREWGLRSSTRRLPARRGVAEFSWLVLLTIPAEMFVQRLLEDLGDQAYERMRALIDRVLRRSPAEPSPARSASDTVVVESAGTGAQFALERDLPIQAYVQLFDELAGADGDGLRTFDRENLRWSLGRQR